VVDASIAIKWMLDDEDRSNEARAILVAYRQDQINLIAPDHFEHEVMNAIRTAVRMNRLPAGQAQALIQDFLSLSVPTVAGHGLFVRGFDYALHFDCAFYDGLYLALADRIGCSFVHADQRLRNTLHGAFSRELWIDNFE
jgi:predicted nucleic acid-binding protein